MIQSNHYFNNIEKISIKRVMREADAGESLALYVMTGNGAFTLALHFSAQADVDVADDDDLRALIVGKTAGAVA
ncbi:MAG: hypothetical protein ACK4SQ_07905 [Allorhizobium sp.]